MDFTSPVRPPLPGGSAVVIANRSTMKSPVHWSLLGLVIERSGYAYELAQRFESTFGRVLPISSTSHVYAALDALSSRSLIEEVPGSREGRQPRPRYRATVEGIDRYGEWLIAEVHEERRRQQLAVLQLVVLRQRPEAAGLLDRYERAWHAEARAVAAAREAGAEGDSACLVRLLAEEGHGAVKGKLGWIKSLRSELGRQAC
jgi:DNA-binding PadR family transcriptional regulator